MLLRSSITSTKKFFQKTLKNFKSLFSSDYQRLPKNTTTDPHNHLSYNSVAATTTRTKSNVMDNMNMNNNTNTSYQELEKLYITDQWDSENQKARRRRIKKKEAALLSSSPTKQQQQHDDRVYSESPFHEVEKRKEFYNKNIKRSLTLQRVRGKKQKDSSCMVEQKLRELEMLDMSNVDHVMDIEEVLHYYSRLTCPAYLEIVDRFFMEMYSELFWPAATPCSVNSRMKLRYQ